MGWDAAAANAGSDTDGDGVSDYREIQDGTNPSDPTSFNQLSKGLVAYYPFNGNTKDESGHGKNLTLLGASLGVDRPGSGNSSLAVALGQRAVSTQNIGITGNSDFTISVWMMPKVDPVWPNGGLIGWGDDSDPGTMFNFVYVPYHVNGFSVSFSLGVDSNYVGAGVISDPVSLLGTWNHVIVTYQGSSKTYRFYLNGKLQTNNFSDWNMVLHNLSDSVLYVSGSFDGLIDDIRIYNRAVSGAEVSQLHAKESSQNNMITVQGGTLPAGSALAGQTVATFQIGKYEVTWDEWQTVRTYAIANGYDLVGVGNGTASTHPVQQVSWYDAVKWSNAKSQMEGLKPVYTINGTTYKTGQVAPNQSTSANGYRLPSEKEWEWAARGGVSSQGYAYSGSNDVNAVAWYESNSSGGAKAVGTKAANELGIYDMSGNLHEWCWDVVSTSYRRMRGGGWGSTAGGCTFPVRISNGPGDLSHGIGFRLARSSGQ
jgi:formylglycine-generating enzyme required for sulfatase activity